MVSSLPSLKRDWYPLSEAAELLEVKVDDLIHLAANGKFQLCILADNWRAERIYQYDRTIKLSGDLREALKVKFLGPTPLELPDVDEPDFEEKLAIWRNTHDSQDLVVGNLVNYGRHGRYSALYHLVLDGLVPVAKKCLNEYLIRPETAKVEIDLYLYLDMADSAQEMFLIPENNALIHDAFNTGRLVVKSEVIKRFLGEECKVMQATPSVAAGKDGNGMRPETSKCYIEWQKRADEKIRNNPSLSVFQIAELIETDLGRDKSPCTRAANTIRKHIKI